MLTPEDVAASLTLAERRATRPAPDPDPLVGSWRRDGLEDDDTFDSYLATHRLTAAALADRLDDRAAPADPLLLDWVQVLDEANATPGAGDVDGPFQYGVQRLERLPFPDFHAPLAAWAARHLDATIARLASRSGPTVTSTARDEMLAGVVSAVLAVTVRALLDDLDAHRRDGGDRSSYAAAHATRAGREATYRAYPVLARDVHRALTTSLRHLDETLTRLAADRSALVAAGLVGSATSLTGVTAGAGDAHDGGRTVTLLTWADGVRTVYRPQPAAILDAVGAVQDLVDTAAGVPGTRLTALTRPGYAWVRFVPREGVSDAAFYRSLGRLAGTSWVLGSRDLHLENVVAGAHGAVAVDQETMLSVTPPSDGTARDVCVERLNAGATGSGLLPVTATVGAGSALDVSVLLGGLSSSTVGVDLLRDPYGDGVRVERGEVRSGQRHNLPDGASADGVRRHLPDLLEGFVHAAQTLRAHEDEVLAALEGDYPVRTVVRPTSLYSLLLHESRHPRYLRSGLAREHLLNRLWTRIDGPHLTPALVAAEVEALLAGDVPHFTVTADGRSLAAPGHRDLSPLEASPLDRVRDQLRRVTAGRAADEADVVREVVEVALATPAGATTTGRLVPAPRVSGRRAPRDAELTDVLDAVLQRFVTTAALGTDDAGWVGLCSAPDSTSLALQPVGTGLFDGLAGIGFGLDLTAIALGEASARALATRALRPVADDLEAWVDRARGPVGAHSGAGGLAYALGTHLGLAAETGDRPDPRAADLVRAYVHRAAEVVADDTYLDVTSGAAGAIAVTLTLAEAGLVDPEPARRLVTACVDRLAVRSVPVGDALAFPTGDAGVRLGGFSHGAAGIGWALARAAVALGDDRAEDLARRALAFDDTLRDDDSGLWRDVRPEWLAQESYPVHWCHGAAGIALARGGAAQLLGFDPATAVDAVLAHAVPANDSLCHGSLGNADVLAHVAGTERAAEVADYRAEALDRILGGRFVPGLGLSATTAPGLMVGFGGLLQHLAHAVRPDLPHALWLGGPMMGV